MNILFTADLAYPDHAGGSHRYYYEVAKRLVQRGHSVHLITGQAQPGNPHPAQQTIDGIIYHRLNRSRGNFIANGLSYWQGARQGFARLSRQVRFDLISAHYVLPTLGVRAAGGRNLPVVFTFHGPWAGEYAVELGRDASSQPLPAALRNRAAVAIAGWLEQRTLRRSARLHTLSNFMAGIAAETYGIPRQKIAVIPGGVDLQKFRPAANRAGVRRGLGLPSDRPILLTVRRLAARMGLGNLISAMAAVVQTQPDALLLIGGKGGLADALQAQVQQLGLGANVRLLGYIAEEALPAYYQAADLFVLPTLELEGFGLVTLEALACGTPVVGTPVGGTVEILSRLHPSLLAPSAQPPDLAQAIVSVLAAPPVSRQVCREFASGHYDWDRTVDQLEQLFLKTAASRS